MVDVLSILIPMTAAAVVISYLDYRKGAIRNRYIITLLVFGVLLQIFAGDMLSQPLKILSVFGFGAFASFLLWFIDILPAGDSKLFTSLLLYFPVEYYSKALILDFLINIFVPIFTFLFIYLILRSGKETVLKGMKRSLDLYRLTMVFLILIGFTWFIYAPLSMIGIELGYFGLLILLFLGYEILVRVSSGKTELAFVLLALMRIVIDYQNALTLDFFLNTSLIVVVFVVIRFFALSLSHKFFSEEVDIDKLTPGMNLAEGLMEVDDGYEKYDDVKASLVGYMMEGEKGFDFEPGPLNEEKVSRLKDMNSGGELSFDTVKIYRKQHFSIFIFAGYILTLVLGTNLPGLLASFI